MRVDLEKLEAVERSLFQRFDSMGHAFEVVREAIAEIKAARTGTSVPRQVAAIVFMKRDEDDRIEAHGFEVDGEDAVKMFGSPRGRELVHLKSWTYHPASLPWTKEKPTAPGWYWVRGVTHLTNTPTKPRIVEAARHLQDGEIIVMGLGYIDDPEFCGPIPEPPRAVAAAIASQEVDGG